MIETNNPEIDVDELMAKIREEIASRREQYQSRTHHNGSYSTSSNFIDAWRTVRENVFIAEQNAEAGSINLPMTRFPLVIRWIARLIGRMVLYLGDVITIPQRKFNQSLLQAFEVATTIMRNMESLIDNQTKQVSELEEKMTRAWLIDQANEQAEKIANLEDGLAKREDRISQLMNTISYLKTNIVSQESRLNVFLEEARRRLPDPFDEKQLETFTNEEYRLLDPIYISFEDQFRGTREEIKDKFRVYLPLVQEVKEKTKKCDILDIGCGRGEWLELLNDEGFNAVGVDTNRSLVQKGLSHDLEIIEGDAIEYLVSLPDSSLEIVTAFHLIEHLPFKMLLRLLTETVRVLKSGGMAIYETPNPENISVGALYFYLDPTHRNPIPSPTMKFIAESRGLCRIQIKCLHHISPELRIQDDGSELVKRFNDYFYGPGDYALIGYKA